MTDSFKITKRDDRADRILKEPDKYYSDAREHARQQIERDLARSTKRERSQAGSSQE